MSRTQADTTPLLLVVTHFRLLNPKPLCLGAPTYQSLMALHGPAGLLKGSVPHTLLLEEWSMPHWPKGSGWPGNSIQATAAWRDSSVLGIVQCVGLGLCPQGNMAR